MTNDKYSLRIMSNFKAMYESLTVDVHPDGLDGRGSKAVLSLAVVATSLGPLDLCNVQRLVEHTGVLEAVRHTAGCLGPSDLDTNKGQKWLYLQIWILCCNKHEGLYVCMETLQFKEFIHNKNMKLCTKVLYRVRYCWNCIFCSNLLLMRVFSYGCQSD